MKSLHHSIEISASKENVWEVLWGERTFRDWAGIIDEGTYMTGTLQEGGEVNFIGNNDGEGSFGVTSRVEKLIPGEVMVFTRTADIQVDRHGKIEKREKQWAGGTERYDLEEHDGKVTLSVTQDVPDELVAYFNTKLPEVLERVKVLAEV